MTGAIQMLAADRRLKARRRREGAARGLLMAAALSSVAVLAFLLYRLAADGIPHMRGAAFWTSRYSPLGLRTGNSGIADAVGSSLLVLGLTMALAMPVGVAAGVYLNEYASRGRISNLLRTAVANLAGVPSVVYGLLGLAVFVRLMQLGASMLAAAMTLGALVLPILIVATEEALKAVPQSVRDASLAMGATKWQTIRHHVLPYALPGILTGSILALSRAAGETAPLLVIGVPVFTSIQGTGPMDLGTPLQVRIYYLSQDARAQAHDLAAAAIVVLLLATLVLNLIAIVLRDRLSKRIKW